MQEKIRYEHIKVLDFTNRSGDVTSKDLREYPFNYSATSAKSYLQRLLKVGFLEKIGSNHRTRYLITKEGYEYIQPEQLFTNGRDSK